MTAFDIVVPTIGRPSLARLLDALGAGTGPLPERVVLVDDRRRRSTPLLSGDPPAVLAKRIDVVAGSARGPAAARNVGWQTASAPWIAFLDDDVVPDADWRTRLADDLATTAADVAGVQGRIRVPLPDDRRPTDWERNVRGLESAQWATADMAYRREVLERVGGFDARFPRAYREDADLALRVMATGLRLTRGRRSITHPVRSADWWVSVRLQAGNADDALMRSIHGSGWRERAGVPRGRRGRHLLTVAAGAAAIFTAVAGERRLAGLAAFVWAAATAEFAWARIAPGPRSAREAATMVATSAVIPAAASYHWLRSWARVLRVRARRAHLTPTTFERETSRLPRAVLFDRDGTLVHDVPYNGDPDRVWPVPRAREALDRLRAAGIKLAVVSNQSGIARGLITPEQVDAVNRQVDAAVGPIGLWLYCPHALDDGCDCRKPAPGLVLRAAAALGVRPEECVVVGDTGADVSAALAAGARPLLVPNGITRPEEVAAAPEVASDIVAAVDRLLGRPA